MSREEEIEREFEELLEGSTLNSPAAKYIRSLAPKDLKFTDLLTSTGRLTRHDDEIEPGDVVSIESFAPTPRLLDVLGVTDDMTHQEATDRVVEAFRRAAEADPSVQEASEAEYD